MQRETGTFTVKSGLAQMLKGGVIMDVVTPSRPRSPRKPARAPSWRSSACPPTSARDGGVARMSDPE